MDFYGELTGKINAALNSNGKIIVAIDGRCGSGKSTLAKKLAAEFSAEVIHLDDFFLRPEQRTEQRLQEVGGNFDRERFINEVISPMKKGGEFSYRPYDCSAGGFKPPITVNSNAVIIVEGSYCCHPQLWDFYDLHVFVTTERETQLERLYNRNSAKIEDFKNKWIPYEEKYFAEFNVEEKCDIIYRT